MDRCGRHVHHLVDGCAGLTEGPQGAGMVQKEGPKEAKREVLVRFMLLPGAIQGVSGPPDSS